MPKNSTLNGKGAVQNGMQPTPFFAPFPAQPLANAKGKGTRSNPFPLMNKVSRVAPADASPRPDHETLGGPLYISGTVCRETDAPVLLAKSLFQLYEADLPPRVLQLKLLLDSARYSAQIFRKAQNKTEEVVRERRNAKESAMKQFCAEATSIRAAQESIVAKPVAQLAEAVNEIKQAERVAMTLHAKPGVPPAATFVSTVVTTHQKTQQSSSTAVPTEPAPIAPKKSKGVIAANLVARSKPRINGTLVAMSFVGTLLGISIMTERKLLDFQAAKDLEPVALVCLAYAMIMGAGLTYINHKAAFEGFRGAGERAAEEATVSARFVNWATLRHTIMPTFATAIIVGAEAVITRNAFVTSNWVSLPDPNNPVHYLSGLLFLLPTAVIGAAQGWRTGRKGALQRKENLLTQKTDAQKAEVREQKEEKTTLELRDSEPAQWAQAWDAYLSKLNQRKDEILAEITRLSQPYENLVAQWEAAFLINPELTTDEVRILQAAREDAVAAYGKFMLELERLRLWQEGIAGDPHTLHLNLTINRGSDGSSASEASTAPAAAAKLSLWQRIIRFFRRLFGRTEETVA